MAAVRMGGASAPRKHGGVQAWLETQAEGPAFGLAVLCMVARAAQFYSGGALALARILGPGGMTVFNILSGVGLAAGCELLASIAGRAWQSALTEAREVQGRRGLTRQERAALASHFQSKARLSLVFMCIGLAASVAAAFSFMWTETGQHSVTGILGELIVTVLLVSVVAYLGIFKESRGEDPADIASAQAYTIRAQVTDAAGRRIAAGTYSAQDVRIVARALPRAERERFESALTLDSALDPLWTARDIAVWLGCDTPAGRRQITRKLARLLDHGAGVLRDDTTGQYRVPRSIVFQHFADDFLTINNPKSERRTPRSVIAETASGQGPVSRPLAQAADSDSDRTATASGHAEDPAPSASAPNSAPQERVA